MGQQKRVEFDVPDQQVVAKANDLVRARHNLSTTEQRIFVAMVAQLDREAEEFNVQEVPLQTISSEANESDLYRRVDAISDQLLEQVVEIRTEDKSGDEDGFIKYNVFSRCQYEKGSGVIRAKFTEDMRPYLLRLKKRFTLYLITVFLRLRSKYSTQIYELLKMRQGLRRHHMTVEELRHSLALENKYPQFSSLKRRVLEQARVELKKKADIYFTYNVVRNGNVPEEIEFYIHENQSVVEELKEETSAIERDVTVGRENQGKPEPKERNQRSPDIAPKAMFKADLTQEEVESISRTRVEELYENSRSKAMAENPDTDSKVLIEQRTYTIMKRTWEEESSE
jgi:plasmid replication initiation protein